MLSVETDGIGYIADAHQFGRLAAPGHRTEDLGVFNASGPSGYLDSVSYLARPPQPAEKELKQTTARYQCLGLRLVCRRPEIICSTGRFSGASAWSDSPANGCRVRGEGARDHGPQPPRQSTGVSRSLSRPTSGPWHSTKRGVREGACGPSLRFPEGRDVLDGLLAEWIKSRVRVGRSGEARSRCSAAFELLHGSRSPVDAM